MEVRLIALFKGKDPGSFTYLQGMRSGRLKLMNPDPEQTEAALTGESGAGSGGCDPVATKQPGVAGGAVSAGHCGQAR
jgi:hypothetical protein